MESVLVKEKNLSFIDPLVPLKTINYIIIHHTGGKGYNIIKTHKFHQNERNWSGIGYNYFIEKNGDIFKGRGYSVGAHAYSYNRNSLGIALAGNFDISHPSEKQLQSLRGFCNYLLKEFNLTPKHVLGHRELREVTKSCPGKNFNLVQFRETLKCTRNTLKYEKTFSE